MNIIRKIFSDDNYLGLQAVISIAVCYGIYGLFCAIFDSKWPKIILLLSICVVAFLLIYKKFIGDIWFLSFLLAITALNAFIIVYFSLYNIKSYIIYYPFLLSEIIIFDFVRRIIGFGQQ